MDDGIGREPSLQKSNLSFKVVRLLSGRDSGVNNVPANFFLRGTLDFCFFAVRNKVSIVSPNGSGGINNPVSRPFSNGGQSNVKEFGGFFRFNIRHVVI